MLRKRTASSSGPRLPRHAPFFAALAALALAEAGPAAAGVSPAAAPCPPTLLGHLDAGILDTAGSLALLSDGQGRAATIADLTDPLAPVRLSEVADGFRFSSDARFVVGRERVWQIDDPEHPVERPDLPSARIPSGPIVGGYEIRLFTPLPFPFVPPSSLIVTLVGEDGLRGEETWWSSGEYWNKVTFVGSRAWLTGGSAFDVVGLDDPANPVLLSRTDLGGAFDSAVEGSLAYVTSAAGLIVYDVADPEAPRELGRAPRATTGHSLAVQDGIAFVTDDIGFALYDVADPERPRLRGTFGDGLSWFERPRAIGGRFVAGDEVFSADCGPSQGLTWRTVSGLDTLSTFGGGPASLRITNAAPRDLTLRASRIGGSEAKRATIRVPAKTSIRLDPDAAGLGGADSLGFVSDDSRFSVTGFVTGSDGRIFEDTAEFSPGAFLVPAHAGETLAARFTGVGEDSTVEAWGNSGLLASRKLRGYRDGEDLFAFLGVDPEEVARIVTPAPGAFFTGAALDRRPLRSSRSFDAGAGPESAWIPAVASAPGTDRSWTTTLVIANSGPVPAKATLRFHPRSGFEPAGAEVALAAGESRRIEDVVGTLLARPGASGSLELRVVEGAMAALARIEGIGVQIVPAELPELSGASSPEASLILDGLEQSATRRTNLLLANTSEGWTRVRLRLFAPDGRELPERGLDLAGGEALRLPLSVLVPGEPEAFATLDVPWGGAVLAGASVVDGTDARWIRGRLPVESLWLPDQNDVVTVPRGGSYEAPEACGAVIVDGVELPGGFSSFELHGIEGSHVVSTGCWWW